MFNVIIIGAGLSGMVAAYRIYKERPDAKILILEAWWEIGGRTRSIKLKTATGEDTWDLGGQWVGHNQHAIQKLLKELNIDIYPQSIKGNHMIKSNGQQEIQLYKEDELPISVTATADSWNIFRKLQNVIKEFVDSPDSFSHEHFNEWSKTSLMDYLKSISWTQEGLDMMTMLLRSVVDSNLNQVSLVYFLVVCGSAGGNLEEMLDDKGNGAQAYKISGGAISICETIAKTLPEGCILLNKAVTRIDQTAANCVRVETLDGTKYECSQVISAIPPCQISRIEFDPPLPAEKRTLMENYYPKAEGCKFIATYDRKFWLDAGFSGQIILDSDSASGGPEIATYDGTTSSGSPGLIGFSNISPKMSASERKQIHLDTIAKFYGDGTPEALDYTEKFWGLEHYEVGCVASIDPGEMPPNFPTLIRDPVGKVHWAGTETACEWMGYMNGAVDAGLRVAEEVLKLF